MPLVSPNLDQRTFEQIVAEVRRRIPTFTPEWTDLNDSDPGMTLAQLFAFMTEQLLFQVNQVPDKGLITFLKMVGADLHPATPAVADVTFLLRDAVAPPQTVQAGTAVETSGPPPGGKNPIAFETSRDLPLLDGKLVELGSVDCDGNFVSHGSANEACSQPFRPFGKARSTEDAFFLAFDLTKALTWPEQEFRLRLNLAGSSDVGEHSASAAEVGQCCGVSLRPAPRIEWSFLSGTADGPFGTKILLFTPIEPLSDSTRELTRSGYVSFKPDAAQASAFEKAPDEPSVVIDFLRAHFVLRARILRTDAYDAPPELHSVRLNTVDARAVTTVDSETLGASTGRAFQRFTLANTPVFPGSTRILIDERSEAGMPDEVWTEVADLFAAGPTDRVYQLIPATGVVLFGDGRFGKVPPPDDDAGGLGIRVASYQFGGGLTGNVGAKTITRVTGVDGLDVINVLAARGGDEEEPVTAGVARAPAVVRSRYRAVTALDFEALAKETPDTRVARARALPDTRPDRDPGRSPGCVTVVLVPDALFEETIFTPIMAPEHVAASVLSYLNARRLITTRVFASSASFRKVTADVALVANPLASLGEVKRGALDSIERYLHALVGGEDGQGWPFGGSVFFSGVFNRMLQVDGVMRVERLLLQLDSGPWVECRDLAICPGELLFSGSHIVRVRAST